MTSIESGERAVTNPDIYNNKVVRIEPNVRDFPHDAEIIVETEPEDYHTLKFRVASEGEHEYIFLTAAEPPLEGVAVGDDRTFWVDKDVLAKDAKFNLSASFPYLAKTSFRAMRLQANVDIVNSRFQR